MDLFELSIDELVKLIRSKKVSSLELIKESLKRINHLDQDIKAFLAVDGEKALEQAKIVDQKNAEGKRLGTLAGIPFSAKDVFATKGVRTTTGSKILSSHLAQYEATVVQKLKNEDAILVGKTNQDEFGRGFTTETSAYQVTSNPWDTTRTPGGSSGGSAASVAAREVVFSVGSAHYDSIRQPAAWCGVVGLKPTYGLVSRYGVIAMASSLECPGPIGKYVSDVALVLETIAGHDEKDANSLPQKKWKFRKMMEFPKNLKVGLPKGSLGKGIDPGVKKRFLEALEILMDLGVEIVPVTLFDTRYSTAVYEILYSAEVTSNLARYDGIRFGYHKKNAKNLEDYYLEARSAFGPQIKAQILTELRSLTGGGFEKIYLQAQKVRRLIANDFERIFKKVDLLISPMSPCVAFKKGFYRQGHYHPTPREEAFRPLFSLYGQPASLVGLPGISVPAGFTKGLPVGLQIFGPRLSEEVILSLASAFEKVTGYAKIKPDLIQNYDQ